MLHLLKCCFTNSLLFRYFWGFRFFLLFGFFVVVAVFVCSADLVRDIGFVVTLISSCIISLSTRHSSSSPWTRVSNLLGMELAVMWQGNVHHLIGSNPIHFTLLTQLTQIRWQTQIQLRHSYWNEGERVAEAFRVDAQNCFFSTIFSCNSTAVAWISHFLRFQTIR